MLAYVGEDFTVDNIQVGVAALATLAGPIPEVTEATSKPAENITAWIRTNYFSPSTTILVGGLTGENRARVGVYDVRGRRVHEVTLAVVDGQGNQNWNGLGDSGTHVPSGVYFLRLEDHTEVPAAKFVLLK